MIRLLAIVVLCGLASLAHAQAPSADQLRARLDAFARVYAAPTDPAALRAYADAALAMRDFETATGVLEQILRLDPSDHRARFQLGASYHALGSFQLAQNHLARVVAAGDAPPALRARALEFGRAAREALRASSLSGNVAVTASQSDGANSASPVLSGGLLWRQDMGNARAEEWVTSLALRGALEELAAQNAITLRSGPELRVTGGAFGPRVMPYLEWSRQSGATARLRETYLGVLLQWPVSEQILLSTDLSRGRGSGGALGNRADLTRASLALDWRARSDLTLSLRHAVQFTDLAQGTGPLARGSFATITWRFDRSWPEALARVLDRGRKSALRLSLGRRDSRDATSQTIVSDTAALTLSLPLRNDFTLDLGLSHRADAWRASPRQDATTTAFLRFGWEF